MKKRDEVFQAIHHQSGGHIPFSIVLTPEAYQAYGERLLIDYPDERIEEDLAHGRLAFEQAVSLAIGNGVVYLSAPWWSWYQPGEHFLHLEDTSHTLPDSIGYGSYENFFAQSNHLHEKYGVYQLVAIWGSHWEKAYFSRGIKNFLCDLAADPKWSQELLDHIIRKNITMLENILACKTLDGILLGSDWGTQRGLTLPLDMWRRMIMPGEKREYDLIKQYRKHVWVHSCGCITDLLDDLCELGIDVLNPIEPECMDIKQLKREYGDMLCFYGGISTQRVLPYGTPSDVIRETEETIECMSEHGGYITAPSQEIQVDVPYENLKALIDTARSYSALGI